MMASPVTASTPPLQLAVSPVIADPASRPAAVSAVTTAAAATPRRTAAAILAASTRPRRGTSVNVERAVRCDHSDVIAITPITGRRTMTPITTMSR
jgi:hypothetical protein